jgi:threonine dehydrogenase-like Zn-dependent dehydrogenase
MGTMMYNLDDYHEAVDRLAAGEPITAPLDSMHFSFEKYQAAYHFIKDKDTGSMNVCIDLQA